MKTFITILITAVVCLVFFFGISIAIKTKIDAKKNKGTMVRIEKPVRGELVEYINAPGQIEPRRQVEISAKISARIVELPFLFDWTFQTEAIAASGVGSAFVASIWVLLVLVKLGLLAWIFQLRPSATSLLIPTLSAWGLGVLTLALLSAGTVFVSRRQRKSQVT